MAPDAVNVLDRFHVMRHMNNAIDDIRAKETKSLNSWCTRTMGSRLTLMKKVAKMLRTHKELLLNWFRAKGRIAHGCVEGFNNKAKVTFLWIPIV